ncbi:MAG: ZIP family metal transporter [Gemmatimonadaceae bacterium]
MRSAIRHFAAGVVFSVVAVELLPDVTRVHDPLEIGLTFAAGLVLMLLVEQLGKRLGDAARSKGGGESATDVGQLAAIGIDIIIDGLLVGIAVAAGIKEGLLLTAALSVELLSLGLAMAASLTMAGASRRRTILLPTGISCLLVIGALAGHTMLGGASPHTLAGVLSFGCAALLYLVVEELLVEAHEVKETRTATSMFFVGFLLFLLLGMVEG